MPLPAPQLGLVISYSYFWHHEQQAGLEEGREVRPCVNVLAIEHPDQRTTLVTVLPVTHVPPSDPSLAIELPPRVKAHLGLDDHRSWVLLHEGNEFVWPGYDLRPVHPGEDRYDYGLLPPKLFQQIVTGFLAVWSAGLDPDRDARSAVAVRRRNSRGTIRRNGRHLPAPGSSACSRSGVGGGRRRRKWRARRPPASAACSRSPCRPSRSRSRG